MSQSDLRDLLTQVHERLGKAEQLDADDRRLLTTVLADIENVLVQGTVATPRDGAEEGLEMLAAKFEADHPAMAETLRRLVDTLGKAGI